LNLKGKEYDMFHFYPLSSQRMRVSIIGRDVSVNESLRSIFIHRILIFAFAACVLASLGCTKEPPSELSEGLSFYRQHQLEEALPLFRRAAEQDRSNPDTYAWLAETYRRLGQKDEAVSIAKKAIEIDPCHSFAHTVIAEAYHPMYGSWEGADQDSAWYHLLKAVACDSTDGNAWLGIWDGAIRRGDRNLEKKALHSFIETGFLTPAVLSYNRWMLRHVPDNSVLLTNGDMDTYPAVALQEVENYRTDVAIVNYSLLNTAWYARFVRDKYGIQLPVTDSELDALRAYQDENGNLITVSHQIMKGWLKQRKSGTFSRPIAISVTVGDRSFAEDTQDHLRLAGAFWLWLPEPADNPQDTSLMRISLSSVNPDDFAGPFVSAEDRSSVRIVSTNRIVTNVTALALAYSEALLESGLASEAFEILTWAEQFEKKTDLGPIFSERIELLKEAARGETH
jgi:tetratricopeptide (TPR) repeat protein